VIPSQTYSERCQKVDDRENIIPKVLHNSKESWSFDKRGGSGFLSPDNAEIGICILAGNAPTGKKTRRRQITQMLNAAG
jgi:hypothetical protein